MSTGIVRSWRLLVAAFVALAMVSVAPATASAASTTDVSGTVYSKNEAKETIVFITDDFGMKNQPITIDMSDMSGQFEAVRVGQSYSITIMKRESDSYLAIAYVSEGSYVQRNDLGTREEFETRGSSIKAHVGNVPEDDESLSQQHRSNDLRHNQDDDHNNGN
jgi:hypothetical protein